MTAPEVIEVGKLLGESSRVARFWMNRSSAKGHDAWAGILDEKMGFQSYEDFSSEINVSEVSSNICLIFIFPD